MTKLFFLFALAKFQSLFGGLGQLSKSRQRLRLAAMYGLVFLATPVVAQVTFGADYPIATLSNGISSMGVDHSTGTLYVLDSSGTITAYAPDSQFQYGTSSVYASGLQNIFGINVYNANVRAISSNPYQVFDPTLPLSTGGVTNGFTYTQPILAYTSNNDYQAFSSGAFIYTRQGFSGDFNPSFYLFVFNDVFSSVVMDTARNMYFLLYSPSSGQGDVGKATYTSSGWVENLPGLGTASDNFASTMTMDAFTNLYLPTIPAAGNEIIEVPSAFSDSGHQIVIPTQAAAATGAADRFGNLFYAPVADTTVHRLVRYPLIEFPNSTIGTASYQMLYVTVQATSSSDAIGQIQTQVQAPSTLEFTIAPGSATCTSTGTNLYACAVPVEFFPTEPGVRESAIQITDSSGAVTSTVYVTGVGNGPKAVFGFGAVVIGKKGVSLNGVTLQSVTDVAADPLGNLYVLDQAAAQVIKYTRTGSGTYTAAPLSFTGVSLNSTGLKHIAVDGAGYVYVDQGAGVVKIANGVASTVDMFGLTLTGVDALNVDSYGTLHVLDSQGGQMIMVPALGKAVLETTTPAGTVHGIVATPGTTFLLFLDNNFSSDLNYTYTFDSSLGQMDGSLFPDGITPLNEGTFATGSYSPQQITEDQAGYLLFADPPTASFRLQNTKQAPVFSRAATQTVPVSPLSACTPYSITQTKTGDYAATYADCGEVVAYPEQDSATISFPATAAGQTSLQDVPFFNMGNESLTLGSGSNPVLSAGFSLDSASTCPAAGGTLAPDAMCTFAVDFTPPSQGSYTGSLQLVDNNLTQSGATQSVALSGSTPLSLGQLQLTAASTSVYTNFPDTLTVTALDTSGQVKTDFTGPVTLSADGSATFTTLAFTNGVGTATATFTAPTVEHLTAQSGSISANLTITVSSSPLYVVTTTADSGTGSLRQALADAASAGAGTVQFSNSVFLTPQTITLTSGALTVPPYTTINGTSFNGANTVTVNGNGASSVFTVASGTIAWIKNLNITHGSSLYGGAIDNAGNLTIASCGLTGNSSSIGGGAIRNNSGTLVIEDSTLANNTSVSSGGIANLNGILTVLNSTFYNNGAQYNGGALMNNGGTVSVLGSTITGNYAGQYGAGIYSNSTLAIGNTILSGNVLGASNSSSIYDDLDDQTGAAAFLATNGNAGGNIVGHYNSSSVTAPASSGLSAFGNYGGTTQTFVPQPGSAAICAGTLANIGGATSDQRGSLRKTVYGTTTCVDSGATQAHYALSFLQDPSDTTTNAPITPAPVAQLVEGINAIAGQTVSVTLTNTPAYQAGTTTAVTDTSGEATFSNVQSTGAETNETLTASFAVTSNLSVTATSGSFNINIPTPQTITFPALNTAIAYGSVSSETLTAAASSGLPVTYSVAGPATESSSTLTFTGPGLVTVDALQTGNSIYGAATPVSQSIMVAADFPLIGPVSTTGTSQTLTFASPGSYTVGSIVVTTAGNLGTAFSLASGGSCQVGTVLTAGQICTVNVTVTPTAPKLLTGTVSLLDNSTPANIIGTIQLLSLRYR